MAGGDAPSPRQSAPEAKAAAVWPSRGACCPRWSSYRPRAMSSGPVPEGALGPGWLLLQSCSHHWKAAEGLPQLLCNLVRDKQVPAAPNEQRQCLPACPSAQHLPVVFPPNYKVTAVAHGFATLHKVTRQGHRHMWSHRWKGRTLPQGPVFGGFSLTQHTRPIAQQP